MRTPLTVPGAVRIGDVRGCGAARTAADGEDLRSHGLFDPAAGGRAEQTAERLGDVGPFGAGAIVAGIGYVVLTVSMMCAGFVLTKLVLDGPARSMGRRRESVVRGAACSDVGRLVAPRLDDRRHPERDRSRRAHRARARMSEVLARDLVPRHRVAPRGHRLRLDDVPRRP